MDEIKAAVERIVSSHTYGDLITHETMLDVLNISNPVGLMSIGQFRARQLRLMAGVEAVKYELLTKHKMKLRAVNGVGYEIIKPEVQHDHAMKNLRHKVHRAVDECLSTIRHTRVDWLDEETKRRRIDANAKVIAVYSLSRGNF